MRDIPFPKLGKGSKIDVLIGSDYNSLLFPMKEVHGGDIGTSKGHGASNIGYLNTCMYHLYSGQSVVMEI